MAVYVDQAQMPYRGMLMSHLLADTTDELLAMADRIGVDRRHIQDEGKPDEHFDVCASKRRLAVQNGAIEVDSRFMVRLIQSRRLVWRCNSCGEHGPPASLNYSLGDSEPCVFCKEGTSYVIRRYEEPK